MNNLILSLSVEARMIIAEIIALIGLTIIIAIYSNNKIKHLNDKTFYLYNAKNTHTAKIKLSLLPILFFIISLILISVQIAFSWNNLLAKNETINTSQTIASTSQQEVQNTTKSETNNTPAAINNNTNTTNTTETQSKPTENKTNENKTQTNKVSENKTAESKTTASNGKSIAYLTFDDGPSSITNSVLDILKKYNVKATFFVINSGSYNKTTLQREVNEGHTIGLHAYDHNYAIAYKDDNSYLDGIDKLRAKVKADTGFDSHYIRFPGGSSNTISKRYSKGIMSRITKTAKQRGYKYYDWNVDDDDAGRARTADDCYNNVVKELRPNRSNIVLMHDFGTNKKILEALPRIIEYCQKNGYTMLPIDDNTPEIHHGISN
ncbi:MAG: polysaccharide deacetylase [Clostridiales bacterium]|nr:polysaccharide deacetylase [Clostridiales bacterium]MBF0988686.1 polysaccharide deacetylase [Clostridiales bacterium]